MIGLRFTTLWLTGGMVLSGPATHFSSLQSELLEVLRVFHSAESLHFVASDTSFSKLRAALGTNGWQVHFATLLVRGCSDMLIGIVLFFQQYLLWDILYGGLHGLQVDLTGVVPECPQHLEMPRPVHFQWDEHESTHMSEAVDWLNQHLCPIGWCTLLGGISGRTQLPRNTSDFFCCHAGKSKVCCMQVSLPCVLSPAAG